VVYQTVANDWIQHLSERTKVNRERRLEVTQQLRRANQRIAELEARVRAAEARTPARIVSRALRAPGRVVRGVRASRQG